MWLDIAGRIIMKFSNGVHNSLVQLPRNQTLGLGGQLRITYPLFKFVSAIRKTTTGSF
jgi:hypothetical protein